MPTHYVMKRSVSRRKVNMVDKPWTDDELISYADTHSRTPVAEFHVDHVKRLLDLAGIESTNVNQRQFWSVPYDQMQDILQKIKERRKASTK